MLTFSFDVRSELFNVVGVWEYPCGVSEPVKETQICNTRPLTWFLAVQWFNNRMHAIQEGKTRLTDIHILPAQSKTFSLADLMALKTDIARAERADRIALSIRNIDRTIATGSREEIAAFVPQEVGRVEELMGYGAN